MSAEGVVISQCRGGELSEILRILAEAPEAAQWSQEALERVVGDTPEQFLLARIGNEIVGFILGRSVGLEEEILNLAVRKGFRRAGVGTELVRMLLAENGIAGRGKTFLEVRESNAGAIAFYEGLGFRLVGRRPGYYRDPMEAALVLLRDTCPKE